LIWKHRVHVCRCLKRQVHGNCWLHQLQQAHPGRLGYSLFTMVHQSYQ
jgi:hypothetical protein